jgi:hypothetical protein
MATWEVRRGARWGSHHLCFQPSLQEAKDFATLDIRQNGSVGVITLIDRDKRVLYYDVHPEMA